MPDKPTTAYLQWRRRPTVGCRFAMVASANPHLYGQRVETVFSASPPEAVAKVIASRITQLLADPQVQAAALVLPGLTTLRKTAEVFLALGNEPKWNVQRTILQIDDATSFVAFNITRAIPFAGTEVPSEALVLGNFPAFPATRRAPVTALEIFVGAPLPNDPGSGKPTTKGHLAHMDMTFPSPDAFKKLWSQTPATRLAALGGVDDLRAKAKVSFVVPVKLAERIGCMP